MGSENKMRRLPVQLYFCEERRKESIAMCVNRDQSDYDFDECYSLGTEWWLRMIQLRVWKRGVLRGLETETEERYKRDK